MIAVAVSIIAQDSEFGKTREKMASRIASVVPRGVVFFKKPKQTQDDRQRPELKRKVSLRAGYLKKLKSRGERVSWNSNGKIKRQKPLKKISRALRERLKVYHALAETFLAKPENKLCIICTVRREHGEDIAINCATEIHHHRGRRGRLLCWIPGFRGSCFPCRSWPHDHAETARQMGLLAPRVQYDVFPE